MSNVSLTDGHIDNAEHCVCCGAVIPEGRQVCIICGLKTNYKQSTADVVEVVRCKDCKYFLDKRRENHQGICMCGEKDTSYAADFFPYADDFCSYGERKDGE